MLYTYTYDRRSLSKGPTTRAMARRIQEERNLAEQTRAKLLSL